MAETTYKTTFFWHDYETFGRIPRRDRPAQFAGLRTDTNLDEVGDPVMLYCQPAPDFLPDPESVLLTGILPQQALQHGVPEHAFAAAIEAELARDGSIGVGYNSIRFDDEVTRHLFWRCLIDPYAREYSNGCSRWDIVDLVRAAWALRPDGIRWPTHDDGRPSFNALQNSNGSRASIVYYVFDVIVLAGRDVSSEPLITRRALLEEKVLPPLSEPVRYTGVLDASLGDLIHAVKTQGFEGLVAKRRNSRYESGQRSGAWMKMRINRGQELVIGGYTIGTRTFDALVVGYYEGDQLMYASRTRNGFTPALRQQLFRKFRGLEIPECPFVNLPEAKSGRWGQGLTKEKMADCRWLKPVLVGQFEFVEWTADNHLRHTKFVALREDKPAREVRRE